MATWLKSKIKSVSRSSFIMEQIIEKDGTRRHTQKFDELMSHYLFEARFGRPGKGNDKGKVEGLVGYVRRNFLVPIPRFDSFDSLNRYLTEHCQKRRNKKLRSHKELKIDT